MLDRDVRQVPRPEDRPARACELQVTRRHHDVASASAREREVKRVELDCAVARSVVGEVEDEAVATALDDRPGRERRGTAAAERVGLPHVHGRRLR
jgi:hypothetical protein